MPLVYTTIIGEEVVISSYKSLYVDLLLGGVLEEPRVCPIRPTC